MEINNTIITQKWLNGISYEVAFWNNVYRWSHTFKGMMEWSNYDSVIQLEGFDANEYLLKEDNPKVYDVGAGMSYAVGSFLDRGDNTLVPLDIHYMDPLAFHFNHILQKYKKQLPKIEIGMAEYLSAFIPKYTASLITIQNALDHSSCPIKGIIEALLSLKEGGVLYLNHHPNEAEMEKYKGFHQYNIDEKEGNLIIWNKRENINVSQLLKDFASVEMKKMANGHIIAIITKNTLQATLPEKLSHYVNDKQDKSELCCVLLQYQYNHASLRRQFRESLGFGIFNMLQFFAQMLPWAVKMKLKRLIKQA